MSDRFDLYGSVAHAHNAAADVLAAKAVQDLKGMPSLSNGHGQEKQLRVYDWQGAPVDLWIDSDGDFGLIDAEYKNSIMVNKNAIPAMVAWLGAHTVTAEERESMSDRELDAMIAQLEAERSKRLRSLKEAGR